MSKLELLLSEPQTLKLAGTLCFVSDATVAPVSQRLAPARNVKNASLAKMPLTCWALKRVFRFKPAIIKCQLALAKPVQIGSNLN